MTAIVCVIFSNNQLKDLPDELESLHLLQEIAISHNRYTSAAHFLSDTCQLPSLCPSYN